MRDLKASSRQGACSEALAFPVPLVSQLHEDFYWMASIRIRGCSRPLRCHEAPKVGSAPPRRRCTTQAPGYLQAHQLVERAGIIEPLPRSMAPRLWLARWMAFRRLPRRSSRLAQVAPLIRQGARRRWALVRAFLRLGSSIPLPEDISEGLGETQLTISTMNCMAALFGSFAPNKLTSEYYNRIFGPVRVRRGAQQVHGTPGVAPSIQTKRKAPRGTHGAFGRRKGLGDIGGMSPSCG